MRSNPRSSSGTERTDLLKLTPFVVVVVVVLAEVQPFCQFQPIPVKPFKAPEPARELLQKARWWLPAPVGAARAAWGAPGMSADPN